MKCVISVDKKHIKRVTDNKAANLYHEGWQYVSKSEWKEKVRDVNKKETTNKKKKKSNKKKSK